MTPLGRLADVVGRMRAAPCRPEIDKSLRSNFAWAIGPECENTHDAWADAIGIAALRNLAPLLIAVAQAANRQRLRQLEPCPHCDEGIKASRCVCIDNLSRMRTAEAHLDAALTALDNAITKELGE